MDRFFAVGARRKRGQDDCVMQSFQTKIRSVGIGVVIARVICAHWACLVVVLASYPQPLPILGALGTVGIDRGPPVWPSTQAECWRLPERQLLLWICGMVCCSGEHVWNWEDRVRIPTIGEG